MQSPHWGQGASRKAPDKGSGEQSSLKLRASVKFRIQFFNFLARIYSFNFFYKSFSEDQKNNLNLACKADFRLEVSNDQPVVCGIDFQISVWFGAECKNFFGIGSESVQYGI